MNVESIEVMHFSILFKMNEFFRVKTIKNQDGKDLKSAEWRAKKEIYSSLSEKIISNFPLHKTEFHS